MSMPEKHVSAKEKAVICKAVADKHGELTARLLVRESDPRNAGGVAHRLARHCGWHDDDATAAQKWREDCARATIRSVEPILIQLGVQRIEAPYMVRDPEKPPHAQGYAPLLAIKDEREVAEDAMRAEIDRAVASLQRAYAVALVLEIQDAAAMCLAALGELGSMPATGPADSALRESIARLEG